MRYSIQLPDHFQTITIRQLLENEWLIPRKVRHFLRVRRNVSVNGETRKFHEEIHAGEVVTLTFEQEDYPKPTVLLGDKTKIDVLFEDEHLLIVNKPVGIKTHPNQPDEGNALLNHAADYLAPQGQLPYVVHRLDKETSGAILFAKNPVVLPLLGRLLERKEIYRIYQGIAGGDILKTNNSSKTTFTIQKKIGRNRHDRRKRIIDPKHGKNAITHVTVVNHHKQKSELEIRLETGRTHQIRVHLESIDHPLLGDPLYHPDKKEGRLQLHAYELYLNHPFTKEKIHVYAQKGKLF